MLLIRKFKYFETTIDIVRGRLYVRVYMYVCVCMREKERKREIWNDQQLDKIRLNLSWRSYSYKSRRLPSAPIYSHVLGQTVLYFTVIFHGIQTDWDRLSWSICPRCHLQDKSTIMKFKPRFHGRKINVETALDYAPIWYHENQYNLLYKFFFCILVFSSESCPKYLISYQITWPFFVLSFKFVDISISKPKM